MGKVTSGKYGEKGRRLQKNKSIKSKATGKTVGSKRRLARMGKEQKAGHKGEAAAFITRSQAVRRLQVSLRDFRRLCILRGIHPRDPKKKAQGSNRTYYHVKDIAHLMHEPLLEKFMEFKSFMKKVRKAAGRDQLETARRMWEDRPQYTLHHVVRERYPQFADAVGDMEDALSMVHLFADLSTEGFGKPHVTAMCERLSREWQKYIVHTHSLRKAFLSIKGIYFQAEVAGQNVTWVVPYRFSQQRPEDVDFKVMGTFLEFYETFMRFVLYKLYHDAELNYPPKLVSAADNSAGHLNAMELQTKSGAAETEDAESSDSEDEADATAAKAEGKGKQAKKAKPMPAAMKKKLSEKLQEITDRDEVEGGGDEEAAAVVPAGEAAMVAPEAAFKDDTQAQALQQKQQELAVYSSLFKGLRFFLNREVPRESFQFVIQAFGGEVGWDGDSSPFGHGDGAITHCIVDRPTLRREKIAGREYVQPQWVIDSMNSRMLLPATGYAHGATLPPHLSPFVDDDSEAYVPEYREKLRELQEAAGVLAPTATAESVPVEKAEDIEARELAKIMMPTKKRKLHAHIMKKKKEKSDVVEKLKSKRRRLKKKK